jgi:hypothetical protein
MARPRGGDRREFVVLYGGGVRKTLVGALTLPNRQPGGRSGDRAAGLRPLIPRDWFFDFGKMRSVHGFLKCSGLFAIVLVDFETGCKSEYFPK